MRVISTAVAAIFLAVSTLGVSAAPLANSQGANATSGVELILQKKPVKKTALKGKKAGFKGKKVKMIKKAKITKTGKHAKKLKAQPTLAR